MTDEIKVCVFCGSPNKTFMQCSCRRAMQEVRNFQKKSKNYVTHKFLGNCPKCGTVRCSNDVDRHLKIVCMNCGYEQNYKEYKNEQGNQTVVETKG